MQTLLHLVIVDDETFMRENLSSIFPWQELGYQVDALCSNGQEAMDYLKVHPVDVVLTDIQMPVMDGIALVREIRKLQIPAEVVFLSAYSDFEYAQKGIYYGAADYLMKPIAYQELVTLFEKLKDKILQAKKTGSSRADSTPSQEEQTLSRISAFIRQYPADASLESCADHTGFSSSYISSLLKSQVSMNFVEYAYQEKMLYAGTLLHDISLQIGTVADMLGYTNAKNFSRAFHNYYHMTPMQYRKLGKD